MGKLINPKEPCNWASSILQLWVGVGGGGVEIHLNPSDFCHVVMEIKKIDT